MKLLEFKITVRSKRSAATLSDEKLEKLYSAIGALADKTFEKFDGDVRTKFTKRVPDIVINRTD